MDVRETNKYVVFVPETIIIFFKIIEKNPNIFSDFATVCIVVTERRLSFASKGSVPVSSTNCSLTLTPSTSKTAAAD